MKSSINTEALSPIQPIRSGPPPTA